MSRLLLVVAFSLASATRVFAADLQAQVYGVAEFPNPNGPATDLITFDDALPNGGRAFDFGQFSHGGALCPANTGQVDYLCASASARVEIDRIPVGTTTYVGVATVVRLKAQARVDYLNADGQGQIWGRATLTIPLACNAGVVPPVTGINVWFRLDGQHSVSVSDDAVVVNAPRPFESCDPGGLCVTKIPNWHCPEGASTSSIVLDLYPLIQIHNDAGHTGWSVQAVSDYSHTFTLEGLDAIDDQDQVVPGVRLVVPDGSGGTNDVFLTAPEALEVANGSSTTTTTTATSTTSTTVPPCATGDVAAASCRCDLRPVAGCESVTLKGAVDKRVNGLCAKLAKAAAATGKKQTRLARQAEELARQTLATVNGRKGNAVPSACRDGLRTFVQAVQGDLAGSSH